MSDNYQPALWRSKNLRIMVTCAILVAMSTVLSFIKLPMPWLIWGGSVTLLSMLPVCLAGLMFGPKWGFGTAFVYSAIQLLVSECFAWGLSPTVLIVCILADYLIAFTVLGITGFFRGRGKTAMCLGVALAAVLRMVCHYISGVTIWSESMPDSFSNIWLYSLAYNGSYMLPELIFTVAGAVAVLSVPRLIKLIKGN